MKKKEVEPFNVTTTALLKNSTNVQLLKQNFQLHLPLSDRKKKLFYIQYIQTFPTKCKMLKCFIIQINKKFGSRFMRLQCVIPPITA